MTLSILQSQFIEKGFKKAENSKQNVVLLLFLFTLDKKKKKKKKLTIYRTRSGGKEEAESGNIQNKKKESRGRRSRLW